MGLSSPGGCYHLRRGVRLTPARDGGLLLQEDPLRVMKVNSTAFDILKKCQHGFTFNEVQALGKLKGELDFFDLLRQNRIIDWSPPVGSFSPFVSIIIPVYNRPAEIAECLTSLQTLNYPCDRLEIIVVDDCSSDQTAAVARQFGVQLIIQPYNQGQSAARNRGVKAARGEIIAFIDSDCIAAPEWLRELVPYFLDARVALVGGGVDALYQKNRLDRYEAGCSALNMGPKILLGKGNHSNFYVPTCNMLVRKDAFIQLGGLDEALRIGEDVDFCWRLMARGHHLTYTPTGRVKHKHRNRFLSALQRRFDYGTSEAVLYKRFPERIKYFPLQIGGIALILTLMVTFATTSFQVGGVLVACLLVVESLYKRIQLKRKMGVCLRYSEISYAIVKSHFNFINYLFFYAVRYFLLLIAALAFALPSLWPLWVLIIFLPTIVDYIQKKPHLSLPEFAFFYWSEHAFYQCGAFWRSFKENSYRLYRIAFCPIGFLPSRSKKRFHSGTLEKKTN